MGDPSGQHPEALQLLGLLELPLHLQPLRLHPLPLGEVEVDAEEHRFLPLDADRGVDGMDGDPGAVLPAEADLAGRHKLAGFFQGGAAAQRLLIHRPDLVGDDQVPEVPADGLLGGITVDPLGFPVPVNHRPVAPVTLDRDPGKSPVLNIDISTHKRPE